MRRLGIGLVAVHRSEDPPEGCLVVDFDYVRLEKWYATWALWPWWRFRCWLVDQQWRLLRWMARKLRDRGRLNIDKGQTLTWGDVARAVVGRSRNREAGK